MNLGKHILQKLHAAATAGMIVQSMHRRIPKTPDLIYMPQVWRWMNTKLRFAYLKLAWDTEFSEGSFIYGSMRAICLVTDIIHRNKPAELNGLLTTAARIRLINTMTKRLTSLQRQIIRLQPVDIKILVPTSIRFLMNREEKKICSVTMRCLALKWLDDGPMYKLVLVALQIEFSRDYTDGIVPEWIFTYFDVLECAQLRNSNFLARR